jgi:hypothetical protein
MSQPNEFDCTNIYEKIYIHAPYIFTNCSDYLGLILYLNLSVNTSLPESYNNSIQLGQVSGGV